MPQDGKLLVTLGAAFLAANALTAAILLLFFGWKIYKVFISILTGCAAALVGWFYVTPHLPHSYGFLAPIVLGAVGIAVAIPLQRLVAFATTGALGAGIAAVIAYRYFNVDMVDVTSTKWQIVAGAGFIVAGVLGAVFFRFLMVFITSAYGGLLGVTGALIMVLTCLDKLPVAVSGQPSSLGVTSMPALDKNWLLGALIAWGVLTLIGMVYQYQTAEPARKSKSKHKDKARNKKD